MGISSVSSPSYSSSSSSHSNVNSQNDSFNRPLQVDFNFSMYGSSSFPSSNHNNDQKNIHDYLIPVTYYEGDSLILYEDHLFKFRQEEEKNILTVLRVHDGASVLEFETDFFKLINGNFYTATAVLPPKISCWDSTTLENRYEKSLDMLDDVNFAKYESFFPNEVYLINDHTIVIYRIKQYKDSHFRSPEYLVWNIELEKFIIIELKTTLMPIFSISDTTLFVISNNRIDCIDMSNETFSTSESYLIEPILSSLNLNPLRLLDFDYFFSKYTIFLNFGNFTLEINRKTKKATCESHHLQVTNRSIVPLNHNQFIVKKGGFFDVWNAEANLKVMSNLLLIDEMSQLRYVQGVLYEINKNILRIWEEFRSNKYKPIVLFDIEILSSVKEIILYKYDHLLFIQTLCDDRELHSVSVISLLDKPTKMSSYQGVLVPCVNSQTGQCSRMRIPLDKMTFLKEDWRVSPFYDRKMLLCKYEGENLVWKEYTSPVDEKEDSMPAISSETLPGEPPFSNTPTGDSKLKRIIPVIGVISVTILALGFMSVKAKLFGNQTQLS